MDSRRQRIALAREKKLLIHAAAQAQRAVDYVLRRRSDRWFTIIAKLFLSKPARALSPFIPLKAKHSTIHFLHSSEVP
jgi:hypothetical protein